MKFCPARTYDSGQSKLRGWAFGRNGERHPNRTQDQHRGFFHADSDSSEPQRLSCRRLPCHLGVTQR
jgi:hypothetical protein